ncbi:hypothetical protein FOA52_011522 [Chlamydomonas sp. UWO 241]|nr:hypothetical protein FOA52_011522 [Chlamydomonas sp. UWO 241]
MIQLRASRASTASAAAGDEPKRPSQQVNMTSFDADDYGPGFTNRRLLVFLGIVAGYMGLYFTRGSLTYTAPVMLTDPALSMTLTDIGVMTSAFPLAYGVSKFVGGVLGARFSARIMLGGGLLLTAFVNLALGMCTSVPQFAGLWFLNGSLQGIGAPASAMLLTSWFASTERGTWWGLWNIGANVGGFVTPLLVGSVASAWGWQWGMWVPGCIGLSLALFSLAVVRDSPEEAGFSPDCAKSFDEAHAPSPRVAAAAAAAAAQPPQEKGGGIREAFAHTIANRGVWLLAFTYFFIYIVRQGATSWLMMFLMQQKGTADAATAAYSVSGLELGGLVGGTLAGIISDSRIKAAIAAGASDEGGHVGKRVQTVMMYVVGTMAVLLVLRVVPSSSLPLQWLCIAALGFTIYGPQMLIGLCGAELVQKSAVSASQGVLGLVAYMGASCSGIPLSYIIQHYGWNGYFAAMAAACVCALALLYPLANARSFAQDRDQPVVAASQ